MKLDKIKHNKILLSVFYFIFLMTITFSSFSFFAYSNITSKHYTFAIGAFILLGISLLTGRGRVEINIIDILVCIFLIYILAYTIIDSISYINLYRVLLTLSFVFIYISFKIQHCKYYSQSLLAIRWCCISLALYALVESIAPYNLLAFFNIANCFDNQSGIAGCIIALTPFCTYLKARSNYLRLFKSICIACIVLAIIILKSRAGFISLSFILILYYISDKRIKKETIFAISLLIIAIIVFTLSIKIDSSKGRYFILLISFNLIFNAIFKGNGVGSFLELYMNAQAQYFSVNTYSNYQDLADKISHPLNEYVLLVIEYGIIPFIILVIFVITIIINFKRSSPFHISLFIVAFFSLLSYPFRYPIIIFISAVCIANVRIKSIMVINVKASHKILFALLLIPFLLIYFKCFSFDYKWGIIAKESMYISPNSTTLKYNYLYNNNKHNGNPYFLYNYAYMLNMTGDYELSNEIISNSKLICSKYESQMLLGENYLLLNKINEAEICFIQACNMIPNRFMPLYKLLVIYRNCGLIEKEQNMAKIIINKKVKIQSHIVNLIKDEARKSLM